MVTEPAFVELLPLSVFLIVTPPLPTPFAAAERFSFPVVVIPAELVASPVLIVLSVPVCPFCCWPVVDSVEDKGLTIFSVTGGVLAGVDDGDVVLVVVTGALDGTGLEVGTGVDDKGDAGAGGGVGPVGDVGLVLSSGDVGVLGAVGDEGDVGDDGIIGELGIESANTLAPLLLKSSKVMLSTVTNLFLIVVFLLI